MAGEGSADQKNMASPELACIANRNLRSRSKGSSDPQEDGGDTTNLAVEDGEGRANQVNHGDMMAQGLVLNKSEANLVLENLQDDGDSEGIPDNVEDFGTKKQVEFSDSVANRMAQTDTLLVRV